MSVVVVPSSAVISHQPSCRHNLLSLSTSIAKEGLRLHLHHSSPVRVSLLTCSPLFRSCVSNLLRVVARRFHPTMKIIRTLLPFFVAFPSAAAKEYAANPELASAPMSTDIPGDSKTANSPNARFRGALSAEGVHAESDLLLAEGTAGKCIVTGSTTKMGCSANEGACCSGLCSRRREKCYCKQDEQPCEHDKNCCGSSKCKLITAFDLNKRFCSSIFI